MGVMKVRSLDTGRELFAVRGHFVESPTPLVAFDGDGRRVAVATTQLLDLGEGRAATRPKVLVFDTSSGRAISTLLVPGTAGKELEPATAPEPKGDIDASTARDLTLSRDGRRAALVRLHQIASVKDIVAGKAGLGTPKIDVWDTTTGRALAEITLAGQDAGSTIMPQTIVFDSSGGRLAVAFGIVANGKAAQARLRVYDVASGRQTLELAEVGEPFVFSPDGTRLAGVVVGQQIRIFNVGSGAVLATLPEHASPVAALAFSPDNSRLATVTATGTVTVWHADFLRQALVLRPSSGPYSQRDAVVTGLSTPSNAHTIRFSDDGLSLLVTNITSDPRGYRVSARRWNTAK